MKFILQRYSDNGKSTLGLLLEEVDKKRLVFQNYILEDEGREEKVRSETRIWSGVYELKISKHFDAKRNEIISPLTKKYRERYVWFKNHIEVVGVKNFTSVYCHIGNTEKDTDACLLFGDTADNNMVAEGFIGNSTTSFRRWYEKVFPHLESGNKAFIEIRDEEYLLV
jgi:hypothetical protein